ncbi:MAG: prepilin-type N-terminal cleavage/methylation domain-containing protein, partial [Eubacteriales bacterium]|nr:prepilin-type N-terminal cleavage/methylation domain-containing protein [Eubacteriales bacterium]
MLTYRKKRNEKQKSLRRKGFTLVETIVVMAILAILASASAAGLIRWQHNAQFRKANEYARTLFTAAQTYLTGAKAQGNLMDPTEFFSDEDLVPERVAGSKDYGRLYSLFWKPSYYKDMKAEYSQKIDPSDTPEEKKGKLFYQMFREYLYDKSVLDASICVEFDPVDGVVEAVLYSDRATSMSYTSGTNGAMEIAKPDREESARREKLLGLYNTEIGDRSPNTTEAPKIDTAELVNGDTLDLRFRLKSGLNIPDYIYEVEILDVEGRTAASFVVNNESSNKLKSSDESGVNEDEKHIKTRVDVYEYSSGGQKIDYQIQDCQIRAYVEDRVVYVTLDAVDLNTAQILKTVGGEWLTDETDDKVKRRNFDHTYSVLRFGNLFATDKEGYDKSLMGTISVRVKAKGARDGSWKMTNSESPLIQVPSSRLAVKSYNIANSRHFFNLRFMEAGFKQNAYDKVTYNLTDSFDWSGKGGILDSNKVFRSERSGTGSDNKIVLAAINPESTNSVGDYIPPNAGQFYNAESQNNGDLQNAASDLLTSCAFPAFLSLSSEHTLDGNNKSVKGLYVIPEKGESDSFQDGLGLFLKNQGTIRNLKLENLNVIGRWKEQEGENIVEKAINRVGGLCAVNQGTVNNVTVQSGLIVGKSCVGGIQAYAGECILTPTPTPTPPAGSPAPLQSLSHDLYVAGSLPLVSIETMIREAELLEEETSSKAVQTAAYEEKVQTDLQMSGGSTPSIAEGIVSNATNRASVEGYSYVGGIVGSVKKNEDLETPFIEKCKNEGSISGATYGLEQKIQYIGGIAGYNEGGTIDSCNSAPALSLDLASLSQGELNELLDPLLKGEYVGGIVGYNKSGNVTGCFTTGGTLIGD